MGDGTIRDGEWVVHTYSRVGLWAFYSVELRVCTVGESVCETRHLSVLIVNWVVLVSFVGGLLATTIILGHRRVRVRILKVLR